MEKQYLAIAIISILINFFLFYRNYKKKSIESPVNYEATAEIVYKLSFFFFSFFVSIVTISNYFFEYIGLKPVKVDKDLLDFAKYNLFLFVIPVTAKLVPNIIEALLAFKGIYKNGSSDATLQSNETKKTN